MWRNKRKHPSVSAFIDSQPSLPPIPPHAGALAAVRKLGKRVPDMRAIFDGGHVRSLTADYATGLYSEPMLSTPDKHAQQFLANDEVRSALVLDGISLSRPQYDNVPNMGFRISFPQEVTTEDSVTYRVFEGGVQVLMDDNGKVYEVHSTLSHAEPKLDLSGIITEDKAVAAGRAHLGKLNFESGSAELLFAEEDGTLVPAYKVVITARKPRRVTLLIVTAREGKVIAQRELLKDAGKRKLSGSAVSFPQDLPVVRPGRGRGRKPRTTSTAPAVGGKVFLRIPDPKIAISKQLFDVVLERLPDPKVLKNDNVIMYVGSSRTPVKAKADGTYDYAVNSREFCAVAVFFAMDAKIEYMKARGMKPLPGPIPVFVEDRSVVDNAYFDPEAYEIHLGVGSGLSSGGLNRYICYDYGVTWHEHGHNVVFVQTPGKDTPGSEGGGIHEAIGDMCDLLMDWLFRHRYAGKLNQTFGVAEVEADRRVIGLYAAPPDGIRIQKNTKKAPEDKTGEPHDDGLIVGGAMADLSVAMIKRDGVPQGIDNFATLMLGALAIVPQNKVTFRDLLNAFLTADSKLNNNANKELISKSFADHGINLASAAPRRRRKGGNIPVIILNGAA